MSTNTQAINAPAAGETVVILVGAGGSYSFSFSLENAVITHRGDDLVITLPDGACVILRGMMAEESLETPSTIILSDGSTFLLTEMMGKFGVQGQATQDPASAENDGNNAENKGEADSSSEDRQSGEDSGRNLAPQEYKRLDAQGDFLYSRARDSSSEGLHPKAGSGVGQFRSDAGELINGIWAMPDLGTIYWDRETERDIHHRGILGDNGSNGFRPVYGTRITLSGSTVNESLDYAKFSLVITSNAGPGSMLALSLGSGSAQPGTPGTLGADYEQSLEYSYDGTTWLPVTPNANGTFSVPVSGSSQVIQLRVPLLDDHINEGNETIRLAVVGLTDASGAAVTDVDPSSSLVASALITEDFLEYTVGGEGELDGPVVSIVRTSSENITEATQGTHIFRVNVKDCITPADDYIGQDNSGLLTQDITISFTVTGTATFAREGDSVTDNDYTFKPSQDLQDLITAGKASLTINADGTGTLILFGKYDANGNPHTPGDGTSPLADAEFADLTFEANIISDGITELLPETIRMTITDVTGNEAQLGQNVAQGTIVDNPSRTWGPVLGWSPATTSQTVNESSGSDAWNTADSTTVTHQITLDAAAPGPIRVEVQIDGNSGTLFKGDNEAMADFKWAGTVEYSDNGSDWYTLQPTNYSFDPDTGKLQLTIPEGADNVRFNMEVLDDMREGEATPEGYTLTLTLVSESGNTDSAAILDSSGTGPGTGISSLVASTTITHDARNGDLEPASFDGPFVIIEADITRSELSPNGANPYYTPESSGKLPFILSLRNPDASGGLYGDAVEDITVTLTISGGAKFQLQDLFEPGAGIGRAHV